MSDESLDALRAEVEHINFELLELLSRRAGLVTQIQALKDQQGLPTYDPQREAAMLARLVERNPGPFPARTITHLYKEIFKASVDLMSTRSEQVLLVSRARRPTDLVLEVGGVRFGEAPVIIAGPCSIESPEQMETVAQSLVERGVRVMRGGAFKPRSSPYAFQGLGREGLVILRDVGRRHGLVTVTEVTDPRNVELVAEHADILQIGSRNMHNYDLLTEVGRSGAPVLLKRGLAASLEELLWSAEYVMRGGSERVMLCERGIRTFAREVRYTLDISAVPLLRQQSYLPVLVDVSHAAGRRDILSALGRAALAAGANGLMVEVHPQPALARSDSQQQLDLDQFAAFLDQVGWSGRPGPATPT